jgi:hypothetical protein
LAALADTLSVGGSVWHMALNDGFAVDPLLATLSIFRNHPIIRALSVWPRSGIRALSVVNLSFMPSN